MDALYQFGIRFIQSIQTLSPALDGIMNIGSIIGDPEFFLILFPLIYWTIDRRIGIRTFLVMIYLDLIIVSLKILFHEPRPYWIGGVKELSAEGIYGIPSSHAGRTLAVSGYLAARVKRNWFWAIIILYILFVGFSRMYLGLHFPHDVLGGWLVGALVIWAVTKWDGSVRGWLKDKPISTQIGLGFLESMGFVLIGYIVRLSVAGVLDPAEWREYAAEARTITHFFSLAGAVFGMLAGYTLMRKYASFNPKGNWTKRGIRYLLGIVGLLVLYFGLDLAFSAITPDETTLGYILRYTRYSLATFWVAFLAPWLFLKTNLALPE